MSLGFHPFHVILLVLGRIAANVSVVVIIIVGIVFFGNIVLGLGIGLETVAVVAGAGADLEFAR